MFLGARRGGLLNIKLWLIGGIALLSFTASDALAASGKTQCTDSVEEYISANRLSVTDAAKAQSIDKCMAGFVNAQNLLEQSTQNVISRCDRELNAYVEQKALASPSTRTWGLAMDQCTGGEMAQAQSLILNASVQKAKPASAPAPELAPVPAVVQAPTPAPAAMNAPAEQGGNIPGRMMTIPAHTSSPQPISSQPKSLTKANALAPKTKTYVPSKETGLFERRRGPSSAGRTRCLPQMDGYIYANKLAPAGTSFQRAVELCHLGRVDEAHALLIESDRIIETECKPAFKAHLDQNPSINPTRMARRIALDLCANGNMDAAFAELDCLQGGCQEIAQPSYDQGSPDGQQEAYYAGGESNVRGGGITQGVRETDVGGTTSRSFCVGELNGYAKENVFVPSTVAFSRAVSMCQAGRLEAGKKEIRLSNAEVVATCEPKLFRLMKENNLSPSKQWWTGAMNLCADGKEALALEMMSNAEKVGDRYAAAPGPKTDIKATEPLPAFEPMPDPSLKQAPPAYQPVTAPIPTPAPTPIPTPAIPQAELLVAPQPAPKSAMLIAPQPLIPPQPQPQEQTLTPPPFAGHASRYQSSPTATVVVTEESCAIKMDKFVLENSLTPSRDGYMEARRACEAGHEKVAQVALINSNARTMTICDPILKAHVKTLGAAQITAAKWQRALALCANGKTDQAKKTLQ